MKTLKFKHIKKDHIVFDETLTTKSLVTFLNIMDFVVTGEVKSELKRLKGIKIKKF